MAADIATVVEQLRCDDRFVHLHRDLPRTAAHTGPAPPDSYGQILRSSGVTPFSHQLEALSHLASGESVVVATPTSSGKSLCYQVPVLEAARRGANSLVIYPTKALAHDQLASFQRIAPPGVTVAAYDGDCTPTERAAVRTSAQVVLTNPEMLHLGILANHRRWDRFLNGLELVVVDEMHTLRGVFGSHVAHVLRRLRRLTSLRRGSEPRFVFTSATIGQPERLAGALAGAPVRSVVHSGAPRGERATVLWNPFAAGPSGEGVADHHPSVEAEAARIAAETVRSGLRTLVFTRSRRGSETTANRIRQHLRSGSGPSAQAVRTYRAGYLSEERRAIEADLEAGTLDCVVATSALELGIDVSGIDAVVMAGFPGTVSSFQQQSGRAGRGTRDSLVVLVAAADQLDQWVMAHPRELFRREPEPAVVNPSNPHVLLPHLGCAADEAPLSHRDYLYWPEDLDEAVAALVRQGRLRVSTGAAAGDGTEAGPRALWSGRGAPAPSIGLRSASAGEFEIRRTDGTPVGTVDAARVAHSVHPGAVYLHQGTAWRVVELDRVTRTASVEPDDNTTYTTVRSETDITLEDVFESREVAALQVSFGRVVVTTSVLGYEERTIDSRRLVARESLEMEPSVLDTTALWWRFPPDSAAGLDDLPGALHAAEHAGIGILPLFALCDRWDLGGVSTPWLPETDAPTVVIHDAHPGGAGAADMAFRSAEAHLRATLEVISRCACRSGCPSCVQSPKCGNGNEPLDKGGAAELLGSVLGTGVRLAG
ncbi:MAG: DEAD/DEAH box helicase [Microthrixaceae bacterium]